MPLEKVTFSKENSYKLVRLGLLEFICMVPGPELTFCRKYSEMFCLEQFQGTTMVPGVETLVGRAPFFFLVILEHPRLFVPLWRKAEDASHGTYP